jgi:hypothetical protein
MMVPMVDSSCLKLAGVWSQAVAFVLVRLAGIWHTTKLTVHTLTLSGTEYRFQSAHSSVLSSCSSN